MTDSLRPSILFLHAADDRYGADRILVQMVQLAVEAGSAVCVLLPDDTVPGWVTRQLETMGVPMVRGPLAPARRRYFAGHRIISYVRQLLRARRFVRQQVVATGASVIHVNTSALLVAGLIGRPRGARLIWHIHEIITQPALMAALFRIAPSLVADRVLAVSDAVEWHLLSLSRDKIRVVRNGIADRPVMPPPEELVVAYVGRLNHWKGYELFLEAAGIVLATNPGVRFVMAGSPPFGEEWRAMDLRERVERMGIGDRMTLLGEVEDAGDLLESVSILVVPSLLPDPLPTTVLEGMRGGRPIVASGHGGIPEMLADGTSGLLVRAGDRQALATAIIQLVRDPNLRERLAAGGRTRFEKEFTLAAFRDRLVEAWTAK